MSPRVRHAITYTTTGALLLTVGTVIAVQLHDHDVPALLAAVCSSGVPLALWEQIANHVHRIAGPKRDQEEPEDGEAFGLAS